MSKTEMMKKFTSLCSKVGFGLKKHSPEIFVTVGVIGTVASAVIACKATTKAGEILSKTKKDLDAVHECLELENQVQGDRKGTSEKYTEEDAKKDTVIIYVQTGIELAKLYAPAIILGTLSLTSMIVSNDILRKRNAALAMAYTAVDTGFKEYRSRVVERFGEEIDKELRHNVKAKTITQTVSGENGEESTEESTMSFASPNTYSDYTRIFDENSSYWEKDSEYNLMFLRAQQNYANDLLRAKGHLFLNEVYDMLDIPRTKAGQIVGWVYNPDAPVGDNYVDFGIYEANSEKKRDFVNGYERSIILDFNVDGPILNYI